MHDSCRQTYSAAEDGWTAGAFHAAVDTFGAAVRGHLPLICRLKLGDAHAAVMLHTRKRRWCSGGLLEVQCSAHTTTEGGLVSECLTQHFALRRLRKCTLSLTQPACMRSIGLGEERNSLSAFLFTWPTGDTSAPAEKLVKVRYKLFSHAAVPVMQQLMLCAF